MGEEEITGKLERFMEEQKLFRGVVGGEKCREQVQCRTTAMNMFIILVVMVMMMPTIVLEQSERVQDSN